MSVSVFDPELRDLPDIIPVFPLTGVLLLPGATLPLNIFEPRYIAMIDATMANGRLIGMVQPKQPNPRDNAGGDDFAGAGDAEFGDQDDSEPVAAPAANTNGPALYNTGCVGRIVQFEETEDGRYIIIIKGLSRFRIEKEMPLDQGGFRQVKADWAPYAGDLEQLADNPSSLLDRDRLIPSLRQYFDLHGLSADWDAIERTPDDRLVMTLCMICPFAPGEKQALLEAPDLSARADIMQALIAMAAHENDDATAIRH